MIVPPSKIQKIKTFGNSMFPLLHDGDIVYLKRVQFHQIHVNDIVTFKKRSKFITHRVIYKKPDYLITKGDNNVDSDTKIFQRQIIGKVSRVKRKNTIFNIDDIYLFQSTLYFNEIVKVKKTLEMQNIEFLFLKGLPLHLYFEKSIPRRIYADCDLLIRRKDSEKMLKIFKDYGYTKMNKSLSKLHKTLQDDELQISLYKIVQNTLIEFDVHFEAIFTVNQLGNLNSLYSRDLIEKINDSFLKEKKFIHIDKIKYPVLSTENLLIFLAHHLSRHSFKGTHRLEFINIVLDYFLKSDLKGKSIDSLFFKINSYKMTNTFYATMVVLNKYFKPNLPYNFLSKLKPDILAKIYIDNILVNTNIFDAESRIEAGVSRFSNQFFLSPNPVRKFFVFIHPKVIYSILWVCYRKLRLTFKRLKYKIALTSI